MQVSVPMRHGEHPNRPERRGGRNDPRTADIRRVRRCRRVGWAVCLAAAWTAGCGGDARVELSAAESIESLAGALELALIEYHDDMAEGDDACESGVIGAFVTRIREAADNPAAQDRHVADFTAALARIRHDRGVEWARFAASRDNVAALREVTDGLRRLAVDSLTLRDEARRYIHALIDRPRSPRPTGTEHSARPWR